MNGNTKYEKIHQFLLGNMTPDEHQDFINEMEQNPNLKNDTQMENKLLTAMNSASDQELKSTINNVHQKLKSQDFFEMEDAGAKIISINKKSRARRFLAVAASVALLVFAWWTFNNPNDNPINQEEVFANHITKETDVAGDVKNGFSSGAMGLTARDKLVNDALTIYESKDYASSLKLFKELNEKYPEDSEVELFLALSHIGLGEDEQAIDILRPLSIGAIEMQDQAKWYLAMSLLKNPENNEETKDLLIGLKNGNDSKFSELAKGVLSDMNWDR